MTTSFNKEANFDHSSLRTSSSKETPFPSPTSPTRNIFGSISSKLRSKSKSSSPHPTTKEDYFTPLPKITSMAQRSSNTRTFSASSTKTTMSSTATSPSSTDMKRQGSSSSQNSEKYFIGRHSNDWVFGGFSVRDNVKKMVGKGSSTHQ